jgi:hypothetical protein
MRILACAEIVCIQADNVSSISQADRRERTERESGGQRCTLLPVDQYVVQLTMLPW